MKKIKLLAGLILLSLQVAFATNYQVGSLAELEARANLSSPGDTVILAPGEYLEKMTLGKVYSGEVVFVMNGVKIIGADDRYTFDLKGKNITLLLKDFSMIGGNTGIAQRGDFIKVIGDNALIQGNNIGLVLTGQNHLVSGITFRGQGLVGIGGNNNRLDPITREFGLGFYRGPANKWRITNCSFYDIFPTKPGDSGGGIRLIPFVHTVIVDNCHFENIGGSSLWFDHFLKGIELYYNTFVNIPNKEGKCIFLEISDPDPNEKSGFVAKVAGNYFENITKHTILISASSGQNPRGIEVWGNEIRGGWGIIAGGMERPFKRRHVQSDPGTWETVNATLGNIYIHDNLIEPKTSRNHGSEYKGQYSVGEIEWDHNYYVIGQEYAWDAPFGLQEGTFTEGRIYTGGNMMNVHGNPEKPLSSYDKHAIVGASPDSFPFPDVFSGIPVVRGARSDIDIPDPIPVPIDTINTDTIPTPVPVPTPIPNTGRTRIWIVSDLSDGRTDPDDRVASSMTLMTLDHFDLKGWTVGAHKWNLPLSLDWFNQNISNAYQQEQPNLNSAYGNYPEVLPMHLASTTGKGYKPGLTSLDEYPSVKALYEAASEGELYVLAWGPSGEIATMLDFASRQTNQSAFLNTRIISHASSPADLNNCIRDAAACEYLHSLASQGKIKLYELGFAGELIDNRTFPKIGTEVLKSKIGKYLEEKWLNEKPDGSDAITIFIMLPEVGGSMEYLLSLKSDGTSNMDKIMNDLTKQSIYDYLIARYAVAAGGSTGDVPVPVPVPTPNPEPSQIPSIKAFLLSIAGQIIDFANALK